VYERHCRTQISVAFFLVVYIFYSYFAIVVVFPHTVWTSKISRNISVGQFWPTIIELMSSCPWVQ